MDAKVIYKYEKDQDDELNLNVGEHLVEVVKVDDGWCEGSLKGTGIRGMFPDNFVELIQPQKQQPSLPHHEPPKIRETAVSKKRRANVTYSYTAENEDELTLEPGQVVEILNEEEEGWWRGSVGGREGVFPSNFVAIEEVDEGPPLPPPVKTMPEKTTRPPSMVAMPGLGGVNPLELRNKLKPVSTSPAPPPDTTRPPPDRPRTNTGSRLQRPLPKAKVMFAYVASQEDEITVNEGDTVEIVDQDTDQDGWWKIRMGSKEGLVPDNFLEPLAILPAKPDPLPPKQPENNPPLPPKGKVEPPRPNPPLPGARSVLPRLPNKVETPEKREPSPEPVVDDLEIPRNEVLESKTKDRPRRNPVRPPSRKDSNVEDDPSAVKGGGESPTIGEEPPVVSSKAPWQQEVKARKTKAPITTPPPPISTTTPTKPAAPIPSAKPKPGKAPKPPSQPQTTPKHATPGTSTAAGGLGGMKSVSAGTLPSTVSKSTEPALSTLVDSGEWRESFEALKEEFMKVKEDIRKELQEEIRILASDLDAERKKVAMLEITVDRLKKTAGYRENL